MHMWAHFVFDPADILRYLLWFNKEDQTLASTTHLLVFLLKRCQNVWYFLLFISQSLSQTAVEKVHLCVSPLFLIQAQFKQLIAELWQLILICEDGWIKEVKLSNYISFLPLYTPPRMNAIFFNNPLWNIERIFLKTGSDFRLRLQHLCLIITEHAVKELRPVQEFHKGVLWYVEMLTLHTARIKLAVAHTGCWTGRHGTLCNLSCASFFCLAFSSALGSSRSSHHDSSSE